MITDNILNLVGNTPILKTKKIDTGPCSLYFKLESQNPTGSVKDRIALHMVEMAEKRGEIKPGDLLIEASSGNMGASVALVGALKGYRVLIVAIDKVSDEKRYFMEGLGAKVVITPSAVLVDHPDSYLSVARRLQKETGGYFLNQFFNSENADAHELHTAPEILRQMEGKLDAIVLGVGTSGTITGISRYMAKHAPHVKIILADPEGSALHHYWKTGELCETKPWNVEGIGEDFVPGFADFSRITNAYTIPDKEAFATLGMLLREEGIFAGTSCGTLASAALRYCREQTEHKHVLTMVCDSGFKYMSKYFNKNWLDQKGLTF